MKTTKNRTNVSRETTKEVENGSSRGGDEIVEFYVRYEGDAFEKPHHKLVGFKRGNVPGHEIAEFHYHIPEKALMSVMENGKSVLLDGAYTLFAGGCQPDERSVELTGEAPLAIAFTVADGKIQIGKETECAPYVYPDQGDYAAHITKRKKFSLDTPFSMLYDNPVSRAVLMETMPMIFSEQNPYADMMKGMNMSIRDMMSRAPGMFPQELMGELERRLEELD